MMSQPVEFLSLSPQMTQQVGYCLGQALQAGDVVCLAGDLGAGKTTLSVGIGQGWGTSIPLTSPTFVIVHQHTRLADQQVLHHLDAYRVHGDAESIGLEDILNANGPLLVEWAEHIQDELPSDYLAIHLNYQVDDSARQILFTPYGQRPSALLQAARRCWEAL